MATSINQIINTIGKIGFFSAALGVSSIALSSSWYVVNAGTRAVMWDAKNGVKLGVIKGEGSHLRIPYFQRPIFVDIRSTPTEIHTDTGSKDLQTVSLSLRVLHRPQVDKLPELIKQYGEDYARLILPSLCNEQLKAVVAQYDASELITQREIVSRQIRETLKERSNQFYIDLDDVSITELSFSNEFTNAIESKQVAQQEAERAKFIVEKSEQEKLAAIIRAEGESEAAKLITEATIKSGPGFIELRRLEAALDIAETLSNSPNVTFIPSESNVFLTMK